jgi:hypothetical protein
MERSLLRILAVFVAAGTLSLVAAPRDAEAVSLNLINLWRMGDMGHWGNGFNGYAGNGPAWSAGAFPRTGINIHFGVGLGKGDQFVPYLGFALNRVGYDNEYLIDEDGDGDEDDPVYDTGSALQAGLDIGAKVFFIERAKGKAPPFVNFAFYKYFGSITEASDFDDAYEAVAGSDEDAPSYEAFDRMILSPTGFRFSFGAEYYFNDNFALGGEFFGLDFAWASGRNPDHFDRLVGSSGIQPFTDFNFWTGLTMTYRFSFTVRASVQFESDYDYED